MSGLLSLPDIRRRLRVLGRILEVSMELSHSKGLAEFSEMDLQDIIIVMLLLSENVTVSVNTC